MIEVSGGSRELFRVCRFQSFQEHRLVPISTCWWKLRTATQGSTTVLDNLVDGMIENVSSRFKAFPYLSLFITERVALLETLEVIAAFRLLPHNIRKSR